MKRSGIRIGFGIALWLGIPLGLGAKTYTFHFPPERYAETCESYRKLMQSGQTVKAGRLAKKYRQEHIWPVFMMNPGEKRTIRFVGNAGFTTSPSTDDYTVTYEPREKSKEFEDDDKKQPVKLRIHRLKVPENKLENWQDMVNRHFKDGDDDDKGQNVSKTTISEITIAVNYWRAYTSMLLLYEEHKNKRKSVADDCFESEYGSDADLKIHPIGYEIKLVSYKLQSRKNDGVMPKAKHENDSDEIALADAETSIEKEAESEDTEASGIPPLLFFDDAGDPVPFNKLLQNGPVVLNFTASYCTACEEELKLLTELHAKRKKPDAQLVVVDIDKKENQDLYMNKFRALMGNKPPARTQLLFDPYQKNYQRVNGDGEEKLPLTLLVDQDGKILRKITGFDRARLEQLYKKLETLR